MQPNISLGARHHHITLRVKNNQSRRRPTFGLSKLLVSGLYWKLFAWGSTFLLDLLGTAGPITRKPREKVELLSLIFLPLFSFHPFPSSYRIVRSKVKFGEYFLATCQYPLAPWITLITLSIYLGFPSNHVLPHVSYGSHLRSLFD